MGKFVSQTLFIAQETTRPGSRSTVGAVGRVGRVDAAELDERASSDDHAKVTPASSIATQCRMTLTCASRAGHRWLAGRDGPAPISSYEGGRPFDREREREVDAFLVRSRALHQPLGELEAAARRGRERSVVSRNSAPSATSRTVRRSSTAVEVRDVTRPGWASSGWRGSALAPGANASAGGNAGPRVGAPRGAERFEVRGRRRTGRSRTGSPCRRAPGRADLSTRLETQPSSGSTSTR